MRRRKNGIARALLIKRFYDIWEERPGRPMPDPGSSAYFELAIEEIMRDIALTEVSARRRSRLARPLYALKLWKRRKRLAILLELARTQLMLSELRSVNIDHK